MKDKSPQTGTIRINCNIKGAKVSGQLSGTINSNGYLSYTKMNYGTYRFTVSKDNYLPQDSSITLTSPSAAKTITLLPCPNQQPITGEFANMKTLFIYAFPSHPNNKNSVDTLLKNPEKYKNFLKNLKATPGFQDITDLVIAPQYRFMPSENKRLIDQNYITLCRQEMQKVIGYIDELRLGKNLWIGTPNIDANNFTAVDESVKKAFKNYIKNMNDLKPCSPIRGYYMNAERMYDKAHIEPLFRDISQYVHGPTINKKLMWSPYYTGASDTARKIPWEISAIVDQATVFDIVFLQPTYYFTGYEDALNGVIESARKQQICDPSGAPLSKKTSKTVVGIQVEVDRNYLYGKTPYDTATYQNRYHIQIAQIKSKLPKGKGFPFSFYAGFGYGSPDDPAVSSIGSDLICLLEDCICPFYHYYCL